MLFVILMTLAAGAQMAHAAKGGRSDFYQKYMSRPSEELIRIGKDYRLRKNKPDSALLFFTIVAGRYTPNMSAEEKREVVEALNMNYFIYSFTYLNYPKAYDVHLVAVSANCTVAVDIPMTVDEVIHIAVIPLAIQNHILKIEFSRF